MSKGICVGTGWYSDSERRNKTNPTCAREYFDPNYLWDVWYPHIKKSITQEAIFIYESVCELYLTDIPSDVELITGIRSEVSRPYKKDEPHDWGASIMMGAQYAYCNELDFIYFEQDCLCYGLDLALEYAKGKNLVYGFGSLASWLPGWAELSMIYIDYDFIPLFMRRVHDFNLHIWNRDFDRIKHPEICIHEIFRDVASYWPFGHGRLTPINWDQEVFYAQQMDSENLHMFIDKVL